MSKFSTLLLMALVAIITGGFCFKAVAEKGTVASGDPLQADPDPLAEVIHRDRELAKLALQRKDELDKQGFNFTWIVNIPAADGSPVQVKLPVVRPADDKPEISEISLWFETTYGTSAMEMLDAAGRRVASWEGQRGEQGFKQALTPGRYVIVVQGVDGAHVHGVIGIKASTVGRCPIHGGRLTEHAADPSHGYWWPYLLVTPAPLTNASRHRGSRRLLVAPNTTAGEASEDVEFLAAMATCDLIDSGGINALEIAKKLGTPVLMPLFPRPNLPPSSNLYLPALTRASLQERDKPSLRRVDLQLIAMIDAARKELAAEGLPVRRRVLMAGFSMSGMFTNRFTVLHPKRVLAAAVGSPGGWPIAPVAEDQGEKLPYPVGIFDVEALTKHAVNLRALRRVRLLFLLGDADRNDSVPCRDSFSATDEKLINRKFGRGGVTCKTPGETLVKRWEQAEGLYHTAGLKRAKFERPYHDDNGVGHEVTPKMRKDIVDMFRTAIRAN